MFAAVLCLLALPQISPAPLSPDDARAPTIGLVQRVTITGTVLTADGGPASGAVVLTTQGGRTSTGPRGAFRLALEFPTGSPDLRVTAVLGSGREAASASVLLEISSVDGTISAGTLQLSSAPGCAPTWLPTFGTRPGVLFRVEALAVFDDGNGPALFVAGNIIQAGGTSVNDIARWDGQSWSAVGGGLFSNSAAIHALTVFDDGSGAGPALYAAGEFQYAGAVLANNIARWDGVAWSALGTGTSQTIGLDKTAYVMTVYDDGTGGGPALFVGGSFDRAGPNTIRAIAKWDGISWSSVGTGIGDGTAFALHSYDDGNGPRLFAGGRLVPTPPGPIAYLMEWDGVSWTPVAGGPNDNVQALAVFDDGGGAELIAGGEFSSAGGAPAAGIASWDGSSWSTLGTGLDDDVVALGVFDLGGGPELFVGGPFLMAGGVAAKGVAHWDGASWSPVGAGVTFKTFDALVRSFAVYDEGNGAGPSLFAGGSFLASNGFKVNNIVRWDGAALTPIGTGLSIAPTQPGAGQGGLTPIVRALAQFDDGSGSALYVGGEFDFADGVVVQNIGRWDDSGWSALDMGVDDQVFAITAFDAGTGAALYVAGDFTIAGATPANRISRWNGSSWEPLGSGMNGRVRALTTLETASGPILIAGGEFTSAGGIPASRVAAWDGVRWFPLGDGMDDTVRALHVTEAAGGGQKLIAGGEFINAGVVETRRVAVWNGSSWTALGGGIDSGSSNSKYVAALETYGGGTGNEMLYAAGDFNTQVNGMQTNQIVRWDGTQWLDVGGGTTLNNFSSSLLVHDDGGGAGRQLYLAGAFLSVGGVSAKGLARWDGSAWSTVGTSGGVPGIAALAEYTFAPGQRPSLVAGGAFVASPSGDSYLAAWGGCDDLTTYCTSGTSANGCQALLSSSGIPSASAASGFVVDISGADAARNGLFFFGANGRQATPWGNGSSFQCVTPPVTRTNLQTTTGSPGTCSGAAIEDFNSVWTASPAKNPGSGAVVQAQFWYRDPQNTSNQTSSMSDAIEFVVGP